MASRLSAPRIAALAALAACVSAGPAGAATRVVRSDPPLFPGFTSGAADYVVRCKPGEPVRLKIAPADGTRVSVDGGSDHRGSFKRDVSLAPGRAFAIEVRRSNGGSRTHHVRCLPEDFPRWHVRRPHTPEAALYLLTPSEFNTEKPGYVAIFDSRGVPLWWRTGTPPPFDAHLLPNGNLAWTRIAINNPASGPAEEHSFDGRLVRTYATVGTSANEHDLQVQPDGTAFMIAYPPRDGVDLSHWDGPSDATVLDGEIQQIGPTGRLLWRWNTGDQIPLRESGRWLRRLLFDIKPLPLPDGRSAYDIAHLNSVEPFGGGRLVLSDRYHDAVYAIDRASKRILWKLGGRKTDRSLKILDDPLAKRDFGGQHDARVLDGGRTLTLYDNGTLRGRRPRALEFQIDESKGTARLVRKVEFREAGESVCCGSTRKLAGGHWVTSWGHTPWVTEQTGGGRLVFAIRFQEETATYRAEPIPRGRLERSPLRRGMDAMASG
ncbi:MAG TPA: arylsulfotransferase family protein [Thermoleophilaceae bacterium]|nr:arylsulfotransferase family protein [Thermoleophilaceae bacterium]